MIEVRSKDYKRIAGILKEKLEECEFYSGHVEVEIQGMEAILTATLVVHHRTADSTEGKDTAISDILPIWWEFEIFDSNHYSLFNDFDFNELRKLFIV